MSLKRFLIPNIIIIFVLLTLNLTGVDSILKPDNDDTTNLTKYVQAQRNILSNYFGEPDLNEMYKTSDTGNQEKSYQL